MWHLQRCTADIQQPQTMCVAEAQAAWLVYIVGVVVAGHGGDFGEEVVTLDAQFGAAVLQMCETLRGRASLPGAAQDEQLQHLERAIVFFFRELRRMFITEDFMQNKVSTVIPRCIHALLHARNGMPQPPGRTDAC